MFSRFQAFHFGMKFSQKADSEMERVSGWIVDDFGAILEPFWSPKYVKNAQKRHPKT